MSDKRITRHQASNNPDKKEEIEKFNPFLPTYQLASTPIKIDEKSSKLLDINIKPVDIFHHSVSLLMSEEDEIAEGNRSKIKNTGETTEKDSLEKKRKKLNR